MDRLKKFYINGILMTAVTLIARYIAVNFNIYVSNKIGAVAMGVFTLITSVYGFALTLAVSGISLATTKLVSEALGNALGSETTAKTTINSIMRKSLLLSVLVSSSVAFFLFAFSEAIGTRLLDDQRTVSSLKILAFSLPAIAVSSSLNGYFTAIRKVYKNAIVQIFSQFARIALSVILLGYVMIDDMESACIAIVLGTTLSEISAFIIHAVLYIIEKRKQRSIALTDHIQSTAIGRKLLKITVPVALSAYVRSALVTIEHLLIPWGIQKSGSSKDISLAAYGTIHSVVFPLVLMPSAISSSFAGLLVPEISESNAMRDKERIDRIVSRVLKTVLIYSIGTAGIMMCLSGELGKTLFPESDAAKYIALISPLIPIMYLDTSVDAILKGLGHQFYCMVINIIDASLSVILVWILLPRFGIAGYVITVYFTEIVNAALSITKLLIVTKTKVKLFDWIAKPLVCIIATSNFFSLAFRHQGLIATSRLSLFLCITVIVIVYCILLILTRAISPRQIKTAVKNFISA